MSEPPGERCALYVGFRNDRYCHAVRISGSPPDHSPALGFNATRGIGSDDVLSFAEGDATQPVTDRNATKLDERRL